MAPGGLAHIEGSLYFAGLRGETLYQAKIDSTDKVSLSTHYSQKYGRLRAVVANDKDLYFTTSNRDGRGDPRSEDDKILRVRIGSN